jgi:hypothetical protein
MQPNENIYLAGVIVFENGNNISVPWCAGGGANLEARLPINANSYYDTPMGGPDEILRGNIFKDEILARDNGWVGHWLESRPFRWPGCGSDAP